MSRYRKVEVRIWNDAKFRDLSDEGKLVFLFVLTHPHMTSLGAMRATIPGLAAELQWPLKKFSKAFQEVFRKPLLRYDEKAGFLSVPNFLKHNPPQSPNVVKSWGHLDDLIPECQMKVELYKHVKAFTEGMKKAFGLALPEVFRKPLLNQELELELEQEHDLKKEKGADSQDAKAEDVKRVWEHFHGRHDRSVFTSEREKLIRKQLAAGYPVETLLLALDGVEVDDWHVTNGNVSIEYALRNSEKIESLAKVASDPNSPRRAGNNGKPERRGETWDRDTMKTGFEGDES